MNIEKYPGWPKNQNWTSLSQWKMDIQMVEVEEGKGLLGSNVAPPKIWPLSVPHPEYVKKWRFKNEETVSKTAEYFGLTEVQVLFACR